MPALRLILGDQLNRQISSLSDSEPAQDLILMCELRQEATYVKHHRKKIALVFSAMRHFAKELEDEGFNVRYVAYQDEDNSGTFQGEVQRAIKAFQPDEIVVTEAAEYRVLKDMGTWQDRLGVPVDIRRDNRFLATHREFNAWANERKQLRMEYFYREMRKKHDVLIEDGKPVGGAWNFDKENRKPPKEGLFIPPTYKSAIDDITGDVLQLVDENFADHFGDLKPFHFAVTRQDALQVLDQFIAERLPSFGDYQDAMIEGEPWMYHAHISFYLNCGLLLPLECIKAAERAYYQCDAPLNAVEGFIRQILGWREYVRGIYWLKMPDYEKANFLNAKRALPEFFWDANTNMNCLQQAIEETKQNAYAHHIQRLMVLGNFALIAGLDPDAVNNWYMIVYADAYQWVELPNVTGMVLFADGGVLGSKPYAASGSYIHKMSNYCGNCQYNVKEKSGPQACPFNYLYWDFMVRNEDKLRGNQRMSMIYRTLDKMSAEKIENAKSDAHNFFKALEAGDKV